MENSLSVETQLIDQTNELTPTSVVHYNVDSWSSYTESYYPENVLLYENVGLMTRWCSDIVNQSEYIVLELERLEVLHSMTFIKKTCPKMGALKQFDVFASYDKKEWFRIFHGCSDYTKMVEKIIFSLEPHEFAAPVKYVKIVLLSGWSYSTNISVWPFYFTGYNNDELVNMLLDRHFEKKSKDALMECMARLRYLDNKPYYLALKNNFPSDKILLIDRLYQSLVFDRDFFAATKVIDQFSTTAAFNKYYNNINHNYEWIQLQKNGTYQSDGSVQPKIRGGHQMCLLPQDSKIYMYGGWDGEVDLGDFWVYHINTNQWKLISHDTSLDGGPTPRSCHQMCLDRKRKLLYILGRFKDYNDEENLKNEFFVYDIEKNTWKNLYNKNLQQYGPPLCFGHQMVYCETYDVIIVFGGNILSEKHYSTKCGQLYFYNIKTQVWRKHITHWQNDQIEIEPRSDHSMHLDEDLGYIIITGGSRGANTIDEFCCVDLRSGDVSYISDMDSLRPYAIPNYSYTMRSTYNCFKREMYLYSGLERYKKNQNASPSSNSLYVYEFYKNKWSCIFENKHTGLEYWSKYCDIYPVPRFAFQFVYDHTTNINYLFGGNPGKYSIDSLRLNDLWACKITKPTKAEVTKKMKDAIYSEQINLWASNNPISSCLQLRDESSLISLIKQQGVDELQDLMCRMVDHYDPKNDYYRLDSANSKIHFDNVSDSRIHSKKQDRHLQSVFEQLSEYFKFENYLETPIDSIC